jgi:hypothetical protein
LKPLYNIYAVNGNNFLEIRKDDIRFINSDFFYREELLKANNLTKFDIQCILEDTVSFYTYTVINEKIYEDIKKLFFHKIISGDLKIDLFTNNLCFTQGIYCYSSTINMYRNKVLTLKEINNLHNVFLNYKRGKDYAIFEQLFFITKSSAKKAIEKINKYPNEDVIYKISKYH